MVSQVLKLSNRTFVLTGLVDTLIREGELNMTSVGVLLNGSMMLRISLQLINLKGVNGFDKLAEVVPNFGH